MILDKTWLWTASALALATCAIHVIAGGRYIARPLLEAQMRSVPKYTSYYCWHLVTITILALAAGFALAALYPDAWELAAAALAVAVSFALWNVALWTWKRQSPLLMPQWMLFALVSAAGSMALWG